MPRGGPGRCCPGLPKSITLERGCRARKRAWCWWFRIPLALHRAPYVRVLRCYLQVLGGRRSRGLVGIDTVFWPRRPFLWSRPRPYRLAQVQPLPPVRTATSIGRPCGSCTPVGQGMASPQGHTYTLALALRVVRVSRSPTEPEKHTTGMRRIYGRIVAEMGHCGGVGCW